MLIGRRTESHRSVCVEPMIAPPAIPTTPPSTPPMKITSPSYSSPGCTEELAIAPPTSAPPRSLTPRLVVHLRRKASVSSAQENRHGSRAVIRDRHVRLPVPVQVPNRDGEGCRTRLERKDPRRESRPPC